MTRWWAPTTIRDHVFVVTRRGVRLRSRTVRLTWWERVVAWLHVRSMRTIERAFLARRLFGR